MTGLVNSSGTQVVAYTYDAWGSPLTTTGTMADTLGKLNPFRYRGYFYDTETGLYYLQSRYYDPGVGRFINADNAIASVSGDIRGYNLFCYCMNNPVNMSDRSGHWPQWIKMLRERWLMQSKKPLLLLSIQSSLRYHLPKDHRQVVCRQKESRGQVKLCQIQTERRSRSVGMDQMATPKETETIIIVARIMARCLSRMTTSGKMVKDRQTIFPPILLTI